MQIFDYHINPKSDKDSVIKSFYFQEEASNQKKIGDLCIVAEFFNSLSSDSKIINNLSNIIKKEFFSQANSSTEQALRKALKKGNRFLEELSNKGNVRWLGNLNFIVIAIKDFVIHFSKTGNTQILLLRGSDYHDIGENLESQQSSDNRSFHFFSNIASGQLIGRDKVIVLTQNIFDFFHNDLSEKIRKQPVLTSKILSGILKEKKEEAKNNSGILFLIFMNQNSRRKYPFLKIKLSFRKMKKETRLIIALALIIILSYFIFR